MERCFGTLQDRLVKALRRVGANDLEQANRYLEEEFLEEWNRRFTCEPAEATDAHRPLRKDQNPASILSHVEPRVVDYTVRWQGRRYQIPAREAKPRMRKASVRVEQRLDGELWLRWRECVIPLRECRESEVGAHRGTTDAVDKPASKARTQKTPAQRTAKRKSRWMGAEIQAVMEACEFKKAVINPAFPAMGRTLVGGRLYVHGVESTPACHLPSMLPSDRRFQIEDAATEEELSGIARMALDQDPPALLVGSAGLARAAAAIVGGRYGRPASSETPRGDKRPGVFVVGTLHEVTAAQVAHLLESCPAQEVEARRLNSSRFEEAADSQASLVVRIPLDRFTEEALGGLVQAAERGLLGGLLVTGGDTARLVCRAMRADAIQLRGEIAPGIPWGVIEGGAADGVQIVTKAGSFGAIDVPARVADRLSLRGVSHAG